ncbi:hypothetical protein LY76DRAFT_366505 [Colletotrichum caudatum]|nr:hypothetical protein LY76DRAFT_366505 [Colletotrichum caudatum]
MRASGRIWGGGGNGVFSLQQMDGRVLCHFQIVTVRCYRCHYLPTSCVHSIRMVRLNVPHPLTHSLTTLFPFPFYPSRPPAFPSVPISLFSSQVSPHCVPSSTVGCPFCCVCLSWPRATIDPPSPATRWFSVLLCYLHHNLRTELEKERRNERL